MKPHKESKQSNYSILDNYRRGTKLFETYIGRKYHGLDVLAILAGVTAPFLGMSFPGVTVGVLESSLTSGKMFLIIICMAAAMKVISVWQQVLEDRQYSNYFQGRILSPDVIYQHIFTMDYEKMESGEGVKKQEAAMWCFFRGNQYGCEEFLRQGPLLIMNLLGFLIYSVIVYQISWWILIYMIVTSVLLGYLSMRVGRYQESTDEDMNKRYFKKKKAFEESFDSKARPDIILYRLKDIISEKLKEILSELTRYYRDFYKISGTGELATAAVNFLRDLIVYILLIGEIRRGELTVSTLLIFVGAIGGYSTWVKGVLVNVQVLVQQSPTMTKLWNYLDYGVLDKGAKGDVTNPGKAHEIKLDDVSYTYEGSKKPSLSHVNLTIHSGEKLALVGQNGAGKSTLAKLLAGLYQPTSGKIYLDGVDVSTLSKEKYFKEIAAVFQEAIVFACSVADNVSCCCNTERAKVESCLKQADLWEKISSLDKGIDTELTTNLFPEGVNLSGGETQKLMLARALYQDAPVLLLDEPTAALDPLAESKVYENYNRMSQGKTAVFISHRLSSTQFCQQVCFLKEGCITEMGTHEELLSSDGDYAKMFLTQAKYYQEQPEGGACYGE